MIHSIITSFLESAGPGPADPGPGSTAWTRDPGPAMVDPAGPAMPVWHYNFAVKGLNFST